MHLPSVRLQLKVVLAFFVTFAAGVFLVQLDEHNRLLKIQRAATELASTHGHLLQERLDRSLSSTYALAAVIRQGNGRIDDFPALADEMLRLYEGISSLALVPDGIVTQIVPLAGNEAAIGHNLLKDPKRSKEALAAIQTRKLTLAGPFPLRQGGIAVIGRLPVFLQRGSGQDRFWGFTAALIPIAGLLESSNLKAIAEADYDYELSRVHPDTGAPEVIVRSAGAPLREPVSYALEVPNGKWTLSMAPIGGWPSGNPFGASTAIAALVALLVAALVRGGLRQPLVLRREVALRTHDLTEANRKLAEEIVERRSTENALRESEARFRIMADAAPVLIWISSVDKLCCWLNQPWLAFTGRTLEQEMGNGWAEGVHSEDLERCLDTYVTAFDRREPFSMEYRLRRHDGEYRWMLDQGVPRLDAAGAFAGYIGSCIDITERKLAEHVLRDSRDALEDRVRERTAELTRTNEALEHEKAHQQALIRKLEEAQSQLLQSEKMASIGQLAAGIAHEINNPIGFVSSNLGTLRDYANDLRSMLAAYERWADPLLAGHPEGLAGVSAVREQVDLDYLHQDLPKLLEETRDGVLRVRNIVQDLKEFSHAGEAEGCAADLHKGMDSTLNVVWNELKYKARVVKAYGVIPLVECIPSQINQVFMNLLVNAAHAIADSGTITLRSEQVDDWVWIEVADTGAGIAPENLSRIFEPFFTTKPVGQGTGLGLSVSYGIIRKHGGRIEVRSEVGQGSAFRVWLPVNQPTGEEPEGGARSQSAPKLAS